MKGLDTSVLLRFLVEDDPVQHRHAAKVIAEAEHRSQQLFLSLLVLCETIWVLGHRYRYAHEALVEVLERLLTIDVFAVERPQLASACLEQFRNGKADFADYVIGALAQHAGCTATYTFDRNLRGAPGFHVL